jgi:hypothetical protein
MLRICLSTFLIYLLLGPAGVVFADTSARRKVDVEFEEVPDASGYQIRVVRLFKDGTRGKPFFFKTKKPVWAAEINPGRYLIELRAFDDRSVPGDWSEPFEYIVKVPPPKLTAPAENAEVLAKEDPESNVEFTWEAALGAAGYRLEIDSPNQAFHREISVTTNKATVSLPVASQYQWRVISRLKEDVDGDTPNDKATFSLVGLPLASPDVKKPLSKIVQEVHWDNVNNAEEYRYIYSYKPPKGKWAPLDKPLDTKEVIAPFDLSRPSGLYRLTVAAKGPLRRNSPNTHIEFEVKGGLRDPAAIESEVLKESLSKPTNFYFIASYLVTKMTYAGEIREAGSKPSFDCIGGTGRLGVGYQRPNDQIGGFAIADLSGVNLDGKNYTFASSEAHGTWKIDLRGRGQTLVGAGLFYKQLPLVVGAPGGSLTDVKTVGFYGPHAGLQYWIPFNAKLGLQFNARGYYGVGGNADSQSGFKSSVSYQYGLLGSYRLNAQTMGYAGYAYRLDYAEFKPGRSLGTTSTGSGDVNFIRMQGHYLNLLLEYSF